MPNKIGIMAAAGLAGFCLILGIASCCVPMFKMEVSMPAVPPVFSGGDWSLGINVFSVKMGYCSWSGDDVYEPMYCNETNLDKMEIDKDNECGMESRARSIAAFSVMGVLSLVGCVAFHAGKLLMPNLPGIMGPVSALVPCILFLISWGVGLETFIFECEKDVNGVKVSTRYLAGSSSYTWVLGPMFGLQVSIFVFLLVTIGASIFGNLLGPPIGATGATGGASLAARQSVASSVQGGGYAAMPAQASAGGSSLYGPAATNEDQML